MPSSSIDVLPKETQRATNTHVDDGKIAYTASDGTKQHLPLEEIIFILNNKGAVADEGFVIFSLHEDESDSDTPYRLGVLGVDTLPQHILDLHLLAASPRHFERGHDLHVVVSTGSGLGMASKFWDLVLQPLLRFFLSGTEPSAAADGEGYSLLVTKTAHCVKDFAKARWAARASPTSSSSRPDNETIILLSGDGGIVDLLNGTTSADPPSGPVPTLALLPLGTANALFHSLHKPLYEATTASPNPPSPLTLALRTLTRGRPADLPSFRATFSPGARLVDGGNGTPVSHLHGAIVASYGFHAQLVWESDTPAYRAHGAARFGLVAAALLAESHAYRAEIDGVPSSSPQEGEGYGYVLATLASNLEKTFTISPASEPLGRRLRVVRFGAVGGERTMEIMKAAYDGGKHVGMEDVSYEAVEGLRVTVREEDARWRKVCVDGTIVEVPEGGSFEVKTFEGTLFGVLVDPSVAVQEA
ncbi:hypothetical protein ACHAQA_005529 [Verticillium albo-atrum]